MTESLILIVEQGVQSISLDNESFAADNEVLQLTTLNCPKPLCSANKLEVFNGKRLAVLENNNLHLVQAQERFRVP